MRLLLHKSYSRRTSSEFSFQADLCADSPDEEKILFAVHKLLQGTVPAESPMGFANGVLELELTPHRLSEASPAL